MLHVSVSLLEEYPDRLLFGLTIADSVSTTAPSVNFSESGTTGWELALVTAPSSNETAAATSKLVLRF